MQYAPTRVTKNPPGFIFPHPDAPKNAPDFTLPNRGAPKTCLILDPNLRRGLFWGVCNTPLHGYMKNLAGFRRKFLSQDILGRMQYAPTRVHEKLIQFHIFPHGYAKNLPDFTHPNKDTPKSRPVLDPNLRRGTFWGRMQYAPTRVHEKFGGFHIFPIGIRQKPARFHPSQ